MGLTPYEKLLDTSRGQNIGVSFEVLCKRFGHSSPAITMRYLGIDDKEVAGILLNEI